MHNVTVISFQALRYGRPLLLLLLLLTGSASSWAGQPVVPVPAHQAPSFTDDWSSDTLKKAIRINLAYLTAQPSGKTVQIAGQSVPLARLVKSLQLFQNFLERNPSPAELDHLIKEYFDIFQAAGTKGAGPDRTMLVTGYYQPVFRGSLTREAPFLHPLYGVPGDLILNNGASTKGPPFGRMENGRLLPYWTREEIEKQRRADGHELVWLRDPFDAYLVHIQGSAIIQLQDGSRRGIHFAAKNGHPYRSIGSYLVRTGRLSRQEASMQTIRDYIAAHPAERDEIFHANPSFIFFEWTDTTAVIGSLGTELTDGRSVAADQSCFPAGALGFLVSRRPTVAPDSSVAWSPLHRFVVVQDSGSAIKGSGRVDLFWGTGPAAGEEAGMMKETGALYLLLAKEQPAQPLPDLPPPSPGKGS
jgi:membrane-bound lytic murein transglycosylase A